MLRKQLVLFALCVAMRIGATMAADSHLDIEDIFDPAAAKRPREGQWLEYLLAYQADPLENSLGANPIPPAGAEPVDPMTSIPSNPSFETLPVWQVLPLRLEIQRVEENGMRVAMRFDTLTQELFLPMKRAPAKAEFRYESPKTEDKTYFHNIGADQWQVTVTRRRGADYGFVRWYNPDLPFGIARFATDNLDLILVGMGDGQPPDFPLPATGQVQPPPGQLYNAP